MTHHARHDLSDLFPGANLQLVDLGLSHIHSLLCIVQLVLDLPVLGHVAAHLLFLVGRRVHVRARGTM